MSRSKSPSPKRNGRKQRSTSRSRSRSRSGSRSTELTRVHIGDIDGEVTKRELEDAFSKFGELREIWIASYPPWFAFAVFKSKREAEECVSNMNGAYVGNCRLRVSVAHPRNTGPRAPEDRGPKCYECNGFGHFARDCRRQRFGGGGGRYNRGSSFRGGDHGRDRYNNRQSLPRRRSYSSRSPRRRRSRS